MKLSPIYKNVFKKAGLLFGAGAVLPVLEGCDPSVQTAVLGGLNTLANTMIDAVFLQIQPDATTTVTVQLFTDLTRTMLG